MSIFQFLVHKSTHVSVPAEGMCDLCDRTGWSIFFGILGAVLFINKHI